MSKIIAGGGQKYYKNRLNLSDCLLGKENSGTVLIEFAICIPILVILLFYANDLVRLYRYHSQTEFVAQQIVNILQNISQKREDKTITRKDLGLSLCLAGLTVYPDSLSMFQDGSKKYRFCHIPQVMVFYVKGLDNGNASCM